MAQSSRRSGPLATGHVGMRTLSARSAFCPAPVRTRTGAAAHQIDDDASAGYDGVFGTHKSAQSAFPIARPKRCARYDRSLRVDLPGRLDRLGEWHRARRAFNPSLDGRRQGVAAAPRRHVEVTPASGGWLSITAVLDERALGEEQQAGHRDEPKKSWRSSPSSPSRQMPPVLGRVRLYGCTPCTPLDRVRP
jgi:hypothetical protein